MAVLTATAITAPTWAQTTPSPDPPATEPEDEWFGVDKALHFSAGTVLSTGGYIAGAAGLDNRWIGVAMGAGFGLVLSALKEGLDAAGLGTPSYKDFVWGALGTVLGIGMSVTFDAALRGPTD